MSTVDETIRNDHPGDAIIGPPLPVLLAWLDEAGGNPKAVSPKAMRRLCREAAHALRVLELGGKS